MALIKKNESVLSTIEQAQTERKNKLAHYLAKTRSAKALVIKATEMMTAAITDDIEDLDAFSAARRNKSEAQDALELYQKKYELLAKAPLFGNETGLIYRRLVAEQDEIVKKAIREILPLFDKAWSIASDAKAEYDALGSHVDTILEYSEINTTIQPPQELLNVLHIIGKYVNDSTYRDKFK